MVGAPAAMIRFPVAVEPVIVIMSDRKSTRLNSSHRCISYAVFCLKKKKQYYKVSVSKTPPTEDLLHLQKETNLTLYQDVLVNDDKLFILLTNRLFPYYMDPNHKLF